LVQLYVETTNDLKQRNLGKMNFFHVQSLASHLFLKNVSNSLLLHKAIDWKLHGKIALNCWSTSKCLPEKCYFQLWV